MILLSKLDSPFDSTTSLLIGAAAGAAALLFLASGVRLKAGVPGPLWHVPLLGETLEFYKSPMRYFYKRIKLYAARHG